MVESRFQGPLCPDCGYDLREQFAADSARRARCPECGAEPTREEARLRWVAGWVRTTPWVVAVVGLLTVAVAWIVDHGDFGFPARRGAIVAFLGGLAALGGGTFAGWSVYYWRRFVLGWFDKALVMTLVSAAACGVLVGAFGVFR